MSFDISYQICENNLSVISQIFLNIGYVYVKSNLHWRCGNLFILSFQHVMRRLIGWNFLSFEVQAISERWIFISMHGKMDEEPR